MEISHGDILWKIVKYSWVFDWARLSISPFKENLWRGIIFITVLQGRHIVMVVCFMGLVMFVLLKSSRAMWRFPILSNRNNTVAPFPDINLPLRAKRSWSIFHEEDHLIPWFERQIEKFTKWNTWCHKGVVSKNLIVPSSKICILRKIPTRWLQQNGNLKPVN